MIPERSEGAKPWAGQERSEIFMSKQREKRCRGSEKSGNEEVTTVDGLAER